MSRRRLHFTYTSPVGGTASLDVSWILPTMMEDGSAIGTITNQKIYYDTVTRMGTGIAYTYSQSVGSGSATSATLTNVPAGTIYFCLTCTVGGVESNYGPESYGTAA